jgi:mannose-6-phosphate isomerase-like protein (cupin superfamily)
MSQVAIIGPTGRAESADEPFAALGVSLGVFECTGDGPGYLHSHDADDEAWHVLAGRLRFRFGNGEEVEAGPGTTVFAPAGVAHDWIEVGGPARYLMIVPRRLALLVEELMTAPHPEHDAILLRYGSRIVDHDRAHASAEGLD